MRVLVIKDRPHRDGYGAERPKLHRGESYEVTADESRLRSSIKDVEPLRERE